MTHNKTPMDFMRSLFLFFVFANFAFYAWFHYLRAPVSAQTQIDQVQISPEKIRIINAPRAAAPAAAKTPVAAACLEWGAFSGAAVARADAAIAELGLPAAQLQRVVADASGFWVHVPPAKSRADAEKTAEELKNLGVTDYSIVQEQTPSRNAISLGIFRSDEAARAYLATLEKKGVVGAVIEKRENFLKQMVFYVREPSEAMVAKLSALRVQMPPSEVRAISCPSS